MIGLFLRAYRICSPEFLQEELDYIKRAFMELKFSETLLIDLQKNAHNISNRPRVETQEQYVKQRYLVAPNNKKPTK